MLDGAREGILVLPFGSTHPWEFGRMAKAFQHMIPFLSLIHVTYMTNIT